MITLLHRYNDDTLEYIYDGWVETYEYDGTTWNARPNIYGFIPFFKFFRLSDRTITVKQNYYEYIDLSEDGNYVMLCGRNSANSSKWRCFQFLTEPQSGHCIIFEYRLITQSEWDNGNTSDDYTPAEGVPVIMADGDTVLDINKSIGFKGDCIFDTDYLSFNSSAQFVNCQIRIHESGDLFAYFANENSYNESGLFSASGAVYFCI